MNNFSTEKIDTLCKEIAYCTDNNYHTENLIKLASFLNEHNIKKALNAILTLRDFTGYLTTELRNIRTDLASRLFYQLEHCGVLTDIDKKRIKSSF